MPPMFIDGRVPVAVTSLDASVSVTTPYLQPASGDPTLLVPVAPNNDILAVLTAPQTMINKTEVNPIIQGGTLSEPNIASGVLANPVITSGILTRPVITSGVLTSPAISGGTHSGGTFSTGTLSSPAIEMTGGQMSGGIINNVILGARTVATIGTAGSSRLDFSTADIYIVQLTADSTLTITNAVTGKTYQVALQQNIADSYTGMSWMTGFINGMVDSGPTQRTAAIDFWTITFDGAYHYGVGAKDVQG